MSRIAISVLILLSAIPSSADAQEVRSPHGRLAHPCADCHQPAGWTPARISPRFDHARAGFGLDGAHATAACTSCHQSLDFQGVVAECTGCHRDIHLGELGSACAMCHDARSFGERGVMRRSHQLGRFPLDGPHLAADCSACHRGGGQGAATWRGLAATCESCHAEAYRATTDPDHVAAAFPRTCDGCHSGTTWRGGRFDHATVGYPLDGAHAAATCGDCHAGRVFRGRDQACVSCHRADYDGATAPSHTRAGFPVDCTLCHQGTAVWQGTASFDHDRGAFPLLGAHRAVACGDCHATGEYRGTPTTCVGCHRGDYDRAPVPNHAAAGFSTECTACHGLTTWRGAGFDHATTQFPLTGGHQAVACLDCHGDGVYRGRSLVCVSCHLPDYEATTDPDHRAAAFVTDCSRCHGTGGWPALHFDHNLTAFPLTGAHLAPACRTCHADGVYAGRGTACASCHQADYDGTTAPNHAASGIPTECTVCHTSSAWAGATFRHDLTRFPLTGAHLAVTCLDCHADGVYRGKPTACLSCHQAAYAGAQEPPHQALGFPTDCTACHTTMQWAGGTFDHTATAFPLTGAHVPQPCRACHGDAVYRGKSTACYACHEPDWTGTTNPNHVAARFPTTCTSCHTTVTWAGARFEHDAQYFPIYTGAHNGKWSDCATCHTDSRDYRVFTCLTCHEHNQTRMDDKHKGRAGYAYDSQACYSCHPNGKH